DPAPFVIANGFADQTEPRVAWNGQHWLVAWGSPNSTLWNHRIDAVRVAPDGTVLDTPPIAVHNTQYRANFELTANGGEWLVVLQSTGAGEADLRGVRISAAGTVTNPGGTQLLASTGSLYSFDIASAGGEYLLVWGNSAVAPRGQRFDAALAPIGGPFAVNGLELASSGTEYFVVWVIDDPYWDDFVLGQRISVFGDLGPVVTLAGSGGGLPLWSPARTDVGWDGSNWWVSWLEVTRGIVFSRVTPDDIVLDFDGRAVAPGASPRVMQGLAVAGAPFGGAEFVAVVDQTGGGGPGDIFAIAVAADAIPDGPVVVSTSAPAQLQVDTAAGNSEVLTVFVSELSGERRIVGQRIDGAGVAIDPMPFEIASGPGVGAPRVGFDGARYLVVWSEDEQIRGKRVRPDGTVIDTVPLAIAAGRSPDVAGQAGTFLVIGTHPGISIQYFHPISMRVRGSDGVNLDARPLFLGASYARNPRVTAFSGRWLATWQRNISHDNPQAYMMACFIEADGSSAGAFLYSWYGGTPDVAVSDARALLVWRSNALQAADNDVLGLVLAADGTFVTAPFVIGGAADKQLNPAVAWNGTEFVVAWEDKRNAVVYFDERTEVFAARVNESGLLQDPDGFAFGDAVRPEILPSVTAIGGDTLIAASSFRDESALQAYRIAYQFEGNANMRPVAIATANPASGEVPLTVSFSAAGSFDPDGIIVDYAWDFGDGTGGAGMNVSHDYIQAGEYLATLTVTDNLGASTSNVAPIVVLAVNQPPVAVATADPVSGRAPLAVSFGSAGSHDPDDGIASFVWDFGDGSALVQGATAFHTYAAAGLYTATLTVTDHSGATAADSVDINVAPPLQPPLAVAAATPQSGFSPLTVAFDSSASVDPDGTIVGWRWEFGDGGVSTEPNPTHVYQLGGVFEAILTVIDDDGASGTDSVFIDVVDGEITVMAIAEETTAGAVTAGSYLDTGVADEVYEALTEERTKGRRIFRRSWLSHTWTFDVAPGDTYTFYLKAHHTPNLEGDDFVFEYRDSATGEFIPMLLVTATAPGSTRQSYTWEPGVDVSGTLDVRVRDTDPTIGNWKLDTLFVDEMVIVTSWQLGPS
ncbi:MAG: PKD domain-containing protein, partial [Rhodospirillales bacterium]